MGGYCAQSGGYGECKFPDDGDENTHLDKQVGLYSVQCKRYSGMILC